LKRSEHCLTNADTQRTSSFAARNFNRSDGGGAPRCPDRNKRMVNDLKTLLEQLDRKLGEYRDNSRQTRNVLADFISGTVLTQAIIIQVLHVKGVLDKDQVAQALNLVETSLAQSEQNAGIVHIVRELVKSIQSLGKTPLLSEEETRRILEGFKPDKTKPN
jgi:hypothetical protein